MTGIIVNVNDQADVHDDGSVMVGSGSESFEVESACQDCVVDLRHQTVDLIPIVQWSITL
jgi:hypothetical protein